MGEGTAPVVSDGTPLSVPALQAAAEEVIDLDQRRHVPIDRWPPGWMSLTEIDARFVTLADPQAVAALCAIAQAAADLELGDPEPVPRAKTRPENTRFIEGVHRRNALRAALGAVSFTDTTTDNGAET